MDVDWESGGPTDGGSAAAATQPQRGARPSPDLGANLRLVDLRGIAKPQIFSGLEKDWCEWKYRFDALLDLIGMGEVSRQAAAWPDPLEISVLGATARQRGKLLQNTLIHVTSGKAFAIVRSVGHSNGLESWRQLVGQGV